MALDDRIAVAYLCEFPTLLGGERSLLQFLAARDAIALEPIVVAPAEGPLARALAKAGIEHRPWEPTRGRGEESAPDLAGELARRGTRIVHANSLMRGDLAVSLGEKLAIPAVTHVRDQMSLSAARVARLNRCAAVIAVSRATAGWLEGQGVLPERIEVVHNAVDLDAIFTLARRPGPGGAADFRAELGVARDSPLIACIGQWSLRKGQDLFLEAAGLVTERMPAARFVLVGERYSQKEESVRFEADLRERANRPPLAGRVVFSGYRDDVPRVLASLDVVVIPSRQEPFSRVALEALAVGVPVVATAVGGTPEIIEDERTGLLVPAGDAPALAAALERVLTDRALAWGLRQRGPDHVRACFGPARQARALRALYDRLLKKVSGTF